MNNKARSTVLLVDDDPINLEILSEFLSETNHALVCAKDGAAALEFLRNNSNSVHAILLDRMMPVMDGMQVLEKIQADPLLKYIPVIIQSARATKEDVREGFDAGAIYYLTKPYESEVLVSCVNKSVERYMKHTRLRKSLNEIKSPRAVKNGDRFEIRTLDDAEKLAIDLAASSPYPEKVVVGLYELLENAIEHGNLGIGYEKKRVLFSSGRWAQEINRLQHQMDNINKFVIVTVTVSSKWVKFDILDSGNGFNWHDYLVVPSDRLFHFFARGIFTASTYCFDEMHYLGNGNHVVASVYADY